MIAKYISILIVMGVFMFSAIASSILWRIEAKRAWEKLSDEDKHYAEERYKLYKSRDCSEKEETITTDISNHCKICGRDAVFVVEFIEMQNKNNKLY